MYRAALVLAALLPALTPPSGAAHQPAAARGGRESVARADGVIGGRSVSASFGAQQRHFERSEKSAGLQRFLATLKMTAYYAA